MRDGHSTNTRNRERGKILIDGNSDDWSSEEQHYIDGKDINDEIQETSHQ